MLPLVQVPEVEPPPILSAQQNLGHQPVLDGVGRAPFARHQCVVAEMPPGIVSETLGPAIHFPAAEHVKCFGVHEEDAARRFALGVAERRDIDAVRSAMHRMRAAVAGGLDQLLRLDHPHDLRVFRVWLGVDDVDAGRAQARHHEIAPLGMRMRRVGAKTRAARVPPIVVKLIAQIRHIDPAHDGRVAGRGGIDVDHRERVGDIAPWRKRRNIGERLGRRLGGEPRRRVKRRIWRPSGHGGAPSPLTIFAFRRGRGKAGPELWDFHRR